MRTHTENWQATAQEPAALLTILDRCEDRVELCADTGNAEATDDKYATLAQLLPRASSIHFKARYAPDSSILADDLQRSFELIERANFDGVITLIYESKQREWAGVEQLRDALKVERRRKPTKPTAASRERRLEDKRRRSETKRMRRAP